MPFVLPNPEVIYLTSTHMTLAKFQHRFGGLEGSTIPSGGSTFMPLERAKTRAQLLKEIRKAVNEAEATGVTDPVELVKKIIESKYRYNRWKNRIKR
jgi:hypothetical protein